MFLSIIVPVYNVEEYVGECLDSLLDQDITKEDYEIICVNDGSTDKSGEIVSDYVMKHSNVVLLEKENGGVGSARNLGLDNAGGDYVWFVDSDDLVQPNVLGSMKFQTEQNNCDRLIFENVYEFNGNLTKEEKNLRQRKELRANARFGDGVVWSCLLKRKMLEIGGGAVQYQGPQLWRRCAF